MPVPVMTVPGELPASSSPAAVRVTGPRKTYADEAWHYELSVEPGPVRPSQQESAVSR